MDIGSKIRDFREDADLSQKEISSMIPMNQSNYSKIERNVQEPSLFQLKRIAEILHIDLNKLFEIDDVIDPFAKDILFAREIKNAYEEIYNKD